MWDSTASNCSQACLNFFCEERLLKINTEKTKVKVFRKSGHLGKKEVWYLGSQKLDVVNNYTYLGYTFTTMLSTNQSVNYLAMKGRKATLACVRALSRCWEISKKKKKSQFLTYRYSQSYCTELRYGSCNV